MGVSSELDAAGIGAHAALNRFVEGGRLGLEGYVADAETFAEKRREVSEDVLGAAGVVEFDMGAQSRERGRDGPDVNVVERDDPTDPGGGGRDGFGLKAAGSALHEDGAGLAQEGDGAGHDHGGNGDRDERIDTAPGAKGDGGTGDNDSNGPERIGHCLEDRATDVEIVVRVAVEKAEDKEVDREPGGADRDDRAGIHRRGIAGEAMNRLEQDVASDGDEKRDMERDRKHLGASVAVGAARIGGAAGERRRGEGEKEARGIGEHVASIGDEGQ